ncbi:MAG: hypothetical protein U0U25_02680 [Flavobacteriales bacterium]
MIDLHGNANKKEVAPDGRKDENVFDIQQGVSINFFVRTAEKRKGQLGKVYHTELWGAREDKYNQMLASSRLDFNFQEVPNGAPYFFFQPKDESAKFDFNAGLALDALFTIGSNGIVTARGMSSSLTLIEHPLNKGSMTSATGTCRQVYSGAKYAPKENYQWKVDEQRKPVPPLDPSLNKQRFHTDHSMTVIFHLLPRELRT